FVWHRDGTQYALALKERIPYTRQDSLRGGRNVCSLVDEVKQRWSYSGHGRIKGGGVRNARAEPWPLGGETATLECHRRALREVIDLLVQLMARVPLDPLKRHLTAAQLDVKLL